MAGYWRLRHGKARHCEVHALQFWGTCTFRAYPSGRDRKPSPPTSYRAYLDVMPEHGDGLPDDKKPDAEPPASRRLNARKSLENFRHILIGNTNSGVDDIDPDTILKVTTAQQNPAARFRVFDRIAEQVAKHGTE
jgi:hypothetical protein